MTGRLAWPLRWQNREQEIMMIKKRVIERRVMKRDVQEVDECIDPDTFEVEDKTDKAKKTKDRCKWAKFKLFLAQKSLQKTSSSSGPRLLA